MIRGKGDAGTYSEGGFLLAVIVESSEAKPRQFGGSDN
jgi:hypothetical protein